MEEWGDDDWHENEEVNEEGEVEEQEMEEEMQEVKEEVLDEAEGEKDDEEMPGDDSNYVSSEEVDGFDLLRDDVM